MKRKGLGHGRRIQLRLVSGVGQPPRHGSQVLGPGAQCNGSATACQRSPKVSSSTRLLDLLLEALNLMSTSSGEQHPPASWLPRGVSVTLP